MIFGSSTGGLGGSDGAGGSDGSGADAGAAAGRRRVPQAIRVAVSGAAGQISNHLLFMLASGEALGKDQPIALNLLGSDRSKEALEGVAMELEDSLYPLLREVNISTGWCVGPSSPSPIESWVITWTTRASISAPRRMAARL